MPAYRWICHVCDIANAAGTDRCAYCTFPAVASGVEILVARSRAVAPARAPVEPGNEDASKPPFTLPQLCLFVLAVWLIGGIPIFLFGLPGNAGEFGGVFGAVNALFSGLAFAGVVYAIFLQRQDLGLQRKELARTSGAGLRQVHIALQKMAIGDEDLQDVWWGSELPDPTKRKQHVYVNLVLANWETLFVAEVLSQEQLAATASHYMERPVFREFWNRAREFRKQMAQAGPASAREFHATLEAAYQSAISKAGG